MHWIIRMRTVSISRYWFPKRSISPRQEMNQPYIIVPSRNGGKVKGNKSARPRHHIYFSHEPITVAVEVAGIKIRLQEIAPFFDDNALDAARVIFGHKIVLKEVIKFIDADADLSELFETKDWEKCASGRTLDDFKGSAIIFRRS